MCIGWHAPALPFVIGTCRTMGPVPLPIQKAVPMRRRQWVISWRSLRLLRSFELLNEDTFQWQRVPGALADTP